MRWQTEGHYKFYTWREVVRRLLMGRIPGAALVAYARSGNNKWHKLNVEYLKTLDRLSRLGFKKEGRRYHPHITVGRVRGAPRDLTTHLAEPFETGDQEVGEFILFQSDLHPSGALHPPPSRVSP